MSRIEDFKIINGEVFGHKFRNNEFWKCNARVQCYLTEEQLDTIGVDRSLVRSVKLAVSQYAKVSKKNGNITEATNERVAELYVKREGVERGFGFGHDSSARRVKFAANKLYPVVKLLNINAKTNPSVANAARCMATNMPNEFFEIIKKLSGKIDEWLIESDGYRVTTAAQLVIDSKQAVDELAKAINAVEEY